MIDGHVEGRQWHWSGEVALVILLVNVFYHTLWNFGAMQSGGDAANLFWPMKLVAYESLREGFWPLWNPWSFMGAPLAASMQHAVFYPLGWLLYLVLPAHVGMNVENLLHLGLAGAGAWFWLRIALRTDRSAAIIFGAAFPCIQWFWGHQEHINQVSTIAWLPWLSAIMHLWLKGRLGSSRFALGFGGISALQFLAGHPQEAFYTHLFCGLLLLGHWARERFSLGFLKQRVVPLAAAGLLGALLIGVQLLPALELSKHSRRQFADPTYAISYSMPPDVLALYLRPHHFGSFAQGYWVDELGGIPDRRAYNEYGLHVGLAALALALLAPLLLRGERPRLALFLTTASVLCLLLALGGNTDPARVLARNFTEFPEPGNSLYEWLARIFPPAQGFRVPARAIIITNFCLVSLAAFSLTALLRRLADPRKELLLAAAAGLIVLGELYVASRVEKFRYPVDVEPMLAQLRLDRLEFPDATLDRRHYRLAIADDNLLIDERHRDTMTPHGNTLLQRFQRLKPHSNSPARVPLVDGYEEGLVPTARFKDFLYDFHRNLRQYRPDPTLLTLLGVRSLYLDPGLPIDEALFPRDGSRSFPDRNLHSVPFVGGAAFWRDAAEGIDFSRLDGPFWRGGSPHPEFSREAVPLPPIASAVELPQLRTIVPTLNSVLIETTPEGGGDAVLAIGWFPGWHHAGSGREVEWLSAVHMLLPQQERGRDGWRVDYRPGTFRSGLFLTALGLSLAAGIAGHELARSRRRRRA